MRLFEFAPEVSEELAEAMAFSRKKGSLKPTMKFRCTSGPRAGKKVGSIAQCSAPIDVDKKIQMKQTRARTKIRQARKARRTKRLDPGSKLSTSLNKTKHT